MKTLIVIGGPTASGKTDIAIHIAKFLNTQILSADSRQCYREMNIGVAKPSIKQLEEVKHYFINSHSIHDEMSAGIYEDYGISVLHQLFVSKDVVVCVGGTGLYIKALCEGIDDMPASDKALEMQVDLDYKHRGILWLRNELEIHDPLFCAQGEMQNPARMQRALVFKLSTGKSIMNYRTHNRKKRAFDIRYFAIEIEKPLLYERINSRVDQMIADGLESEVLTLMPFRHLKALQTVGYQEFFDYFDGHISRDEAISKIKQHSRNYAKRQMTWFRHQQQFVHVKAHYENIIKALKV